MNHSLSPILDRTGMRIGEPIQEETRLGIIQPASRKKRSRFSVNKFSAEWQVEENLFFYLGYSKHKIEPFLVREEETDVVSRYMSDTLTCANQLDRPKFLHFSARIDRNSTEFNYNGTRVTVTADQLQSLAEIGAGHFSQVFLFAIDEPVQMSIAVKVSLYPRASFHVGK